MREYSDINKPATMSPHSSNDKVEEVPIKYFGISMIKQVEDTIKVGTALGFNMDGCQDMLQKMIADMGDKFETKCSRLELWSIRQVWGNTHFDFANSSARGKSGGILCVWNNLIFHKHRIISSDCFVAVQGLWIHNGLHIMFVTVYAPQDMPSKLMLWSQLTRLISDWNGRVVVMGDFNEVRIASERFGSVFNARQADYFNLFISNLNLIDVPLGGYRFTWTDKWASKMSKLDRYLISECTLESFPNITGLILEKGIPDHRPILLKESVVDYGPTPFRLYHSWLNIDGFQKMVVDTWNSYDSGESDGIISFKKKLQNLKHVIRAWNLSKRAADNSLKKEHTTILSQVDAKVDLGTATSEDINNRLSSMKILSEIERNEARDIAQKAKVRWAIEGDENTSFFHGMLKKKRRQNTIKGILNNGTWIEEPGKVKAEFFSHFSNRFSDMDTPRISIGDVPLNPITEEKRDYLEREVSIDEIKKAVWDCGAIELSPDGFTSSPISLNDANTELLEKSLQLAQFCYWESLSAETLAFLKGRNILDGPLILNECMAWYRKRKKALMVFKVDFEKAFDSLSWKYLDEIMGKLGFGCKWRNWISGCLMNSRASILVNGSPTNEFVMQKGLRQGDPMSSFLFILAMEGLHALISKAESLGLYKGANIGRGSIKISHLLYADDVTFVGEWAQSNAYNLISILRCFYLVSGLKININKSKIIGVNVPENDIINMAFVLGCGIEKIPMLYLGVPVGGNMKRCENWKPIVQKFASKMSQWKAKILSVGGRLSLIKAVLGNIPTYYMSLYWMPITIQNQLESMRNRFFIGGDLDDKKITWVKWKSCLASKAWWFGFGSHLSVQRRVAFKWYGGSLRKEAGTPYSPYSPWSSIIRLVTHLRDKGMDLLGLCSRLVGNGASTKLWSDIWCGDVSFKDRFPRIYALELNKDCYIDQRYNVENWSSFLRRPPRNGVELSQFNAMLQEFKKMSLSDSADSWKWGLTSVGYTVASARQFIDDTSLPGNFSTTRWTRCIPIKINIFIWKLRLNKLPTLDNMNSKGIDVDSLLCPICHNYVECTDHLFFACDMAKEMWSSLGRWCSLVLPECSSIHEWFSWIDAAHMPKRPKIILEGVTSIMLWSIWNFRNSWVFSDRKLKKANVWDLFVHQSYLWISSRNPKFSIRWIDWIKNPTENLMSSLFC
ncbi:RNA-directed DNA polymerase, eukaryota [Tanacetum coccineum]